MEIWKIGKNGRLYKKLFRTKHRKEAVNHFFDPAFPAFAFMIQEELMKDNGCRWIVFSEAEAKKLFKTAKIFVNPERGTCSSQFLDCVLEPVKRSYRKPFTVTHINPLKPGWISPHSKDFRLAIHIES
ncbi:MAG: hypothetical protein NTV02_03605 [Candidatus Zambryskibacteria bacterium]|nr:hypothetical protein [Candidatus Zambryskibacteria bacterium]